MNGNFNASGRHGSIPVACRPPGWNPWHGCYFRFIESGWLVDWVRLCVRCSQFRISVVRLVALRIERGPTTFLGLPSYVLFLTRLDYSDGTDCSPSYHK